MIKSIYIKNMVCPRCISAVEQTLQKLKIPFLEVKLGEVIITTENIDYKKLNDELKTIGFEIIKDKNKKIVEQIKVAIFDLIHQDNIEISGVNFSDYLRKKTGYDYSYISHIFSKEENYTIEKFIISQKIEKVKELISYNEMNFTQIAYSLGYGNISHLSRQFKKITGQTLSEFKNSTRENKT